MAELTNFPMVSQLTQITSDGRPSENSAFDCVAASICAGVMWLKGVYAVNGEYNPDRFKDAAYGENWANEGTAAVAYVDFCKSLGIRLYSLQGSPGELVQMAHQHIQLGHPVVFTEPDPYVPDSLGWTHVCVFHREVVGGLVSLDPYIAQDVTRSDADWASLLRFDQIWILEHAMIDLSNGAVANYFTDGGNGTWKCKQNGNVVLGGILAFYRSYGPGLAGLTNLGLPVTNELHPYPSPRDHIVVQQYERGVVAYDPGHLLDNPPGAGDVYLMHLPAQADPGLQTQLASLQGKLKQINQLSTI